MRSNILIILLVLIIAAAFYFLGKRNGAGQTRTDIVENVTLVKEIAQLASLQVNGVSRIKVSNKGDNSGIWDRFRNYFTENTLQLSIPYEAKYGVDMSNQQLTIDTKAGTATVHLPAVKLMSMQLRLDKMESMTQTGIFSSDSIEDAVKAQKNLYTTVEATLVHHAEFIKLAEDNISNTLNKYYTPLGFKVKCVFGRTAENTRMP